MAVMTSLGLLGNNLANKFRSSTDRIYNIKDKNIGKACYAADVLFGIAAVVLGILALLKILPIPPSMVEPFGYGAIAAGGLNLLISMIDKTARMCW